MDDIIKNDEMATTDEEKAKEAAKNAAATIASSLNRMAITAHMLKEYEPHSAKEANFLGHEEREITAMWGELFSKYYDPLTDDEKHDLTITIGQLILTLRTLEENYRSETFIELLEDLRSEEVMEFANKCYGI